MAAVENVVEDVRIPYPEANELHLRISVGACQLRITPADGETWVSGSYRHPQDTLPLRIEQAGGNIRIGQETGRWAGLWGAMDRDSVPRFDLRIGNVRPFALTLEVGASDNEIDLGGLPVGELVVKQGAGRAVVDFSRPNPQVMNLLELSAGASSFELRRLGNANFLRMRAEGGAAGFSFDFDGRLQHDAQVIVKTGMAGVEASIPATTAAKATVESVMGGVDLGDGFMRKDGAYWNEAALNGSGPLLTIQATIALGGLKLRSRA